MHEKQDPGAIGQMLATEVGNVNSRLAEKIMSEPPPRTRAARRSSAAVQAELQDRMQKKIWWWIHYYTVRDRTRFTRSLIRGENYRPLVQQVLKQYRLPPELYYLAMIESGYVTGNTSKASAVGIWQFMRPTARRYGLGVAGGLDERRHPIAATHAAARYLTDLHKQFHSWYLAIAAYNAGQGRIGRAIHRGHTTDFWKLAERGLIPRETMEYLPKFFAAATVGEHRETFGFRLSAADVEWPEIASIDLKLRDLQRFHAGTRDQDIARIAGLSVEDLKRYNPQLRQALARRDVRAIRIWMPRANAERFVLPNTMVAETGRRKRRTL